VTNTETTPSSDLEKLPGRLSPSRANDYLTCPKLFYYKTILGLSSPPTLATIKGNLAHSAFERIFDHPRGQRDVAVASSYILPAWKDMSDPDLSLIEDEVARARAESQAKECLKLAPKDSEEEQKLLADSAKMVENWFLMERVNNFDPTEVTLADGQVVDGRELHLLAEVAGVTLHGFVDRLDSWVSSDGKLHYSISDYKTGKVPQDRYLDKYWLQLRIYAVLSKVMFDIDVSLLRLVFVASGDRDKGIKKLEVTDRTLNATQAQVKRLWQDIQTSARTGQWDTKTGPLCAWCHFQDICPAWNPQMEGVPVSK
jgi:putative RecB family exonuclease